MSRILPLHPSRHYLYPESITTSDGKRQEEFKTIWEVAGSLGQLGGIIMSRETIDGSAVPRPIAVLTIPAEGILFNAGNYRIAGTGPSQLSSAILIPLARICLSLSSRFGNVKSSDEKNWEELKPMRKRVGS